MPPDVTSAVENGGWRPIDENTPRDFDTPILVLTADGPEVVSWFDVWKDWTCWLRGSVEFVDLYRPPTLWMPIPLPRRAALAEEDKP